MRLGRRFGSRRQLTLDIAFSSDDVRMGASAAALMVFCIVWAAVRRRGLQREAGIRQKARENGKVERRQDDLFAGPADFTTTLTNERKEQPCSDTSSALGAGPRYRPADR